MEPHNLERLFHEQGVDLIIQAHEHSYERLYPLFDGVLSSQSMIGSQSIALSKFALLSHLFQ